MIEREHIYLRRCCSYLCSQSRVGQDGLRKDLNRNEEIGGRERVIDSEALDLLAGVWEDDFNPHDEESVEDLHTLTGNWRPR